MESSNRPIILFDGVCNLCAGSVQVVIRHDAKQRFQFASLQSSIAGKLLAPFLGNSPIPDSFVLIENSRMFTRSTAALRVARNLNGFFPLLYGFILVPRFIRDAVYKLIAANRFRWFGKKDSCWLPSPDLAARFLDRDEPNLRPPHAG